LAGVEGSDSMGAGGCVMPRFFGHAGPLHPMVHSWLDPGARVPFGDRKG